MKTLITPTEVVTLAFADGEFITAQSITEANIIATEERHIVPVVGRKLHTKLLAGLYPEFTTQYLAAAVALFTRAAIQPLLDIRTGQGGTVAPRSSSFEPASDAALRRLQKTLRTQARTLLGRASRHLAENSTSFPEYDDDQNILKKCTIHGNLVQVR
ncbi:MAG: hypothetical protein RSB29_02530 [Alistipes sp.]